MFVAVLIPTISAGVDVLLTFFEAIKSKISLKITKLGSQMQKIAMDLEDCGPAHQIGFIVEDEMEEEPYEQDEP